MTGYYITPQPPPFYTSILLTPYVPRRRKPYDIKPSPSDRYLPFARAAHTLATKIFGPDYPRKFKNLPEAEILRTLIRHMYDETFRKQTGVEDPIDVEMVNLLRGKRLPTPTHPLDDIYDPYVRDRETGDFTLPHSASMTPTRAPYKDSLYPLFSFFRLLKLYHRNDKELSNKLEFLLRYAASIDAFLPHPNDYPVSGNLSRPLLDEFINSLPNLHPFELFTHQNYDTHAKPWIEKLEENYKTRAPHQSLATSLALLSGQYDNLHYISRYANTLDHLHRAGILPLARELAKNVKNKEDIFRIITTRPDLIEKITTTDTPHQALAVSLALLSGLHKDLQSISRYANTLDHIQRLDTELFDFLHPNNIDPTKVNVEVPTYLLYLLYIPKFLEYIGKSGYDLEQLKNEFITAFKLVHKKFPEKFAWGKPLTTYLRKISESRNLNTLQDLIQKKKDYFSKVISVLKARCLDNIECYERGINLLLREELVKQATKKKKKRRIHS